MAKTKAKAKTAPASSGAKKVKAPKAAAVVQPDSEQANERETTVVRVRAKPTDAKYAGEYGHKRRRPGDVFDMHLIDESSKLPTWVERIEEEADSPTPHSRVRRATVGKKGQQAAPETEESSESVI